MSTDEVPFQTVSLDHPDNSVVFTESGEPFYSLDTMIEVLKQDLIRKTLVANALGTDTHAAYCVGIADLIANIENQRDALRDNYLLRNCSPADFM